MKRIDPTVASLFLTGVLAIGCSGGGETAVIGFANDGNTLSTDGNAEEVAEALADSEATPVVTDDMIAQIFGAILNHAREGDPEAALIVLKVAEAQREAEEE